MRENVTVTEVIQKFAPRRRTRNTLRLSARNIFGNDSAYPCPALPFPAQLHFTKNSLQTLPQFRQQLTLLESARNARKEEERLWSGIRGQNCGVAATSFATKILTFRCGYWKIAASAASTSPFAGYVCNCLAYVALYPFKIPYKGYTYAQIHIVLLADSIEPSLSV